MALGCLQQLCMAYVTGGHPFQDSPGQLQLLYTPTQAYQRPHFCCHAGPRIKQAGVQDWAVDTPVQLQPKPGRPPRSRKVVTPPSSSPGTNQNVPLKFQATLDLHNSLRATHQAPALTWDDALAAQAAAYADTCNFQHGAFGENMFVTSQVKDDAAALDAAVKAW